MKLEKVSFIKSVMFMLMLLIFLPGMQGIKHEGTSYSGVIEQIDKDFKFLVINGAKMDVSQNTRILDENGNSLKTDALKPALFAVIEGVTTSEGFLAKKIVIRTPKKKQ
jgi:hypothetical protein